MAAGIKGASAVFVKFPDNASGVSGDDGWELCNRFRYPLPRRIKKARLEAALSDGTFSDGYLSGV